MLFGIVSCYVLWFVVCCCSFVCLLFVVVCCLLRVLRVRCSLLSVVVCNGCSMLSVVACCGCCLLLCFTTKFAVVCGFRWYLLLFVVVVYLCVASCCSLLVSLCVVCRLVWFVVARC